MPAPTLHIAVERDDDGSLWATVDELPGLFASGATAYDLEEALHEAIGMYMSSESTYVRFETRQSLAAMILDSDLDDRLTVELATA